MIPLVRLLCVLTLSGHPNNLRIALWSALVIPGQVGVLHDNDNNYIDQIWFDIPWGDFDIDASLIW